MAKNHWWVPSLLGIHSSHTKKGKGRENREEKAREGKNKGRKIRKDKERQRKIGNGSKGEGREVDFGLDTLESWD